MLARALALFLSLIDWLLSFIPGTKAYANRKLRELVAERLARLASQSQKRYPGAKALRLPEHGTVRNPHRSIRRMYAGLWDRAFQRRLSGRQWTRLRDALAHDGKVRGRAAWVNYFLNGGEKPNARQAGMASSRAA